MPALATQTQPQRAGYHFFQAEPPFRILAPMPGARDGEQEKEDDHCRRIVELGIKD